MKLIKNAICAGVTGLLAVASAGSASAQAPYDWTGIYAGGNLGASAQHIHWAYFNDPNQTVDRDQTAFAYGIQAGGQMQFGRLVVGGELGLSGTKYYSKGPDAPNFAARFNTTASMPSILTIGPRIGYAHNNWLFYATGGYAQVTTQTAFILNTDPTNNDRRSLTTNGWFVGGGIEHALTKNWIVGFDYRHVEGGKGLSGPNLGPPVTDVSRYVNSSADEFKARLSFKIGP